MRYRKLSSGLSVCGQIAPGDIGKLAAEGFRTIICNRPNHETPDQPETALIRSAAADSGLVFVHQPIVSGAMTDADVQQFADIYHAADKPILAYCRSGMRCTALWALANPDELEAPALLATAMSAGYDLSPLFGSDAPDRRILRSRPSTRESDQ